MIPVANFVLEYLKDIVKDMSDEVAAKAIKVAIAAAMDAFDGNPGLDVGTRLQIQGVVLHALVTARLIQGVSSVPTEVGGDA